MKNIIDKNYINKIIKAGENPTHDEIQIILGKASRRIKLNHLEISMLMSAYEEKQVKLTLLEKFISKKKHTEFNILMVLWYDFTRMHYETRM